MLVARASPAAVETKIVQEMGGEERAQRQGLAQGQRAYGNADGGRRGAGCILDSAGECDGERGRRAARKGGQPRFSAP